MHRKYKVFFSYHYFVACYSRLVTFSVTKLPVMLILEIYLLLPFELRQLVHRT